MPLIHGNTGTAASQSSNQASLIKPIWPATWVGTDRPWLAEGPLRAIPPRRARISFGINKNRVIQHESINLAYTVAASGFDGLGSVPPGGMPCLPPPAHTKEPPHHGRLFASAMDDGIVIPPWGARGPPGRAPAPLP